MSVRRIGRPVARGGEDLGHQKTVGVILALHGDVVDVAQIGAGARAGSALDAIWPNPPRRGVTFLPGAAQTAIVQSVLG
jgi:hypothetical protein